MRHGPGPDGHFHRASAGNAATTGRRFAPLYRLSTLASISGRVEGDSELAYSDVKAAWQHYLGADNGSPGGARGVLLVGHSQGARHLARLIAEEIAGKPVADRIVAAHVIGWPIAVLETAAEIGVPPARSPALPLCGRANDTGCTVAYVTFAASRPPAATNRFAGRQGPELMTTCLNPAALPDTPMLAPIFPARPQAAGSTGTAPSMAPTPVATPFYRLSGLAKGQCMRGDAGTSFLAVSSSVPRIGAGFQAMDAALPGWGLHLVEKNIALGNLLGLARRQGEAWVARNPARTALGKDGGGR